MEAELGTPYQVGQDWSCPWTVRGIHDRERHSMGADSWQSLCLAMRIIGVLLQHFLDTGGKLMLYGEDFCVDAYFDLFPIGSG